MTKLLNRFHEVIYELIGLHRQLLDCVREEYQHLLAFEIKRIQEATHIKEGLVAKIASVETERKQALSPIAAQLKRSLEELSLSQLILDIQGEDLEMSERLRSAQNTLGVLVKRIQEQNVKNSYLVEKSLVHVNEMKRNILGESAPRSKTYSSKGAASNAATSESRILSQEI